MVRTDALLSGLIFFILITTSALVAVAEKSPERHPPKEAITTGKKDLVSHHADENKTAHHTKHQQEASNSQLDNLTDSIRNLFGISGQEDHSATSAAHDVVIVNDTEGEANLREAADVEEAQGDRERREAAGKKSKKGKKGKKGGKAGGGGGKAGGGGQAGAKAGGGARAGGGGGGAKALANKPGLDLAARWIEGANCSSAIGGLGTTANMDEFGYLEVAELCCNFQMEFFITRVVISMGYKVCHQSGIMGLVPWYSCGDFQSLETLQEDIRKGAAGATTCPYVTWANQECAEQAEECKGKVDEAYHRRRVCDKVGGYSGNGPGAEPIKPSTKSDYVKNEEGKVIKLEDGKVGGTKVNEINIPSYGDTSFDSFDAGPAPAPPPKMCMATFMNMGGTTVMNTMVQGESDYELDVACCNKCTKEEECTFWVRKSGVAPGTACYLRKLAKGVSNSLAYRGGWRKENSCGGDNGCFSSFDYMSGTIVDKVGVCGKTEQDLDQHCCQKCKDHEDCEFWVRERGYPDSGYRGCQLMKNPGSKSVNILWRGGWKQGCKDFGACHASFMNRAGSLIDKLGVCGENHQVLDSACCHLCSKDEDCEFWTRESGSYGSQFCWLYKNANMNEAHSANRRGGWNKICNDGDGKDQCMATFQTINGATVMTTRVCGKSDAGLDTECCQKCKDNNLCEAWVRERGSKGFRTCWLKRGSTTRSSNANHRGGFTHKTQCGDEFVGNNCRASFYDWAGPQIGPIRYVCGKTSGELDAHCCALCRNETLCTHWVREAVGSTVGEGQMRPRACWLRRAPGNPSKNLNRRGGWRQGCGKSVPNCTSTFTNRGGSQIARVAVCGSSDPLYLDAACCDVCARTPECEIWVRQTDQPTFAQGAPNTSYCWLRKNAAVNPSFAANMRGGWNRICGNDKLPACGASFQEMHGHVVGTYRVCGKSDAQLDAECCDKCKQLMTCDFWIREKASKGFVWCWARRKGNGRKSAHANRRGGYKTPAVCGNAFLENGCKSDFDEMSGAQLKIEFVCGATNAELDAHCCALCRNDTRCEFWVRETRVKTDPPTRPKMCWLRWNAGAASKNANRRGGWREGCDNQYPAKCNSTFTDRSGPEIDKRGVCGNGSKGVKMDDYLDSACCDLCAKNKDCEFWVRETNIPAENNTFCYLRRYGALTETVRTNKRGGWNRICGNPDNEACGAIFQEIHSHNVAQFRVCGKTDAQLDAECCAKCKDNNLCNLWVRENGKDGWRWCWLRRNGNGNKAANNNRRGGFKEAATCGDKFLTNGCESSFDHVAGSQVGYDFVCGNTEKELDAHCCAKCRNNTRCEFWIRQSGKSGIKACWLRMNPGGITKNAGYRGGWKQGCGAAGLPDCRATFTDWNGPEVNRLGVCGDSEKEMDAACCALCAAEKDCEFWVRDAPKKPQWPANLCYLRKLGSTERVATDKRGGWKACPMENIETGCEAQFMEMSGPQVAVERVCGTGNDKLDAACCAKCDANPSCMFWVRESGEDGYRYCWLRRHPGGASNNNNRRGGFKKRDLPKCDGTFGDMSGPQVAAYTVYGGSDKELDAECCNYCRKNMNCEFWVRDYRRTFPSNIGGKTCWLRRYPNFNSRSATHPHRRGGMKPESLLIQQSAAIDGEERVEGEVPVEDPEQDPDLRAQEQDPDLREQEHDPGVDAGQDSAVRSGQAKLPQWASTFAESFEPSPLSFFQTGSESASSSHLWTQADAHALVNETEEQMLAEAQAKAMNDALENHQADEVAALERRVAHKEKVNREQREQIKAEEHVSDYNTDISSRVHESGHRAALDERGYKAVAALKDDNEMAAFIRRAAKYLGLDIASEEHLQGIVPYYSGKEATQSFEALLLELEKGAYEQESDGDKWIAPEGEQDVSAF